MDPLSPTSSSSFSSNANTNANTTTTTTTARMTSTSSPTTAVRSISPLAPRDPLPGQSRGYLPSSHTTTHHNHHHNHNGRMSKDGPLPPPPPLSFSSPSSSTAASSSGNGNGVRHWRGEAGDDGEGNGDGNGDGDGWGPTSPIRSVHHQPYSTTSTNAGMTARSAKIIDDHSDRRNQENDDYDDDDDHHPNEPQSERGSNRSRNSRDRDTTTTPIKKVVEAGYVRIKVVGLDKNRRDIYIKFNAESNLPTYRNSTYRSISRSYSECQKFSEAMSVSCPQSILPALPFSQTNALTDDEDDRLVKNSFQKWFARLTNDRGVIRDEELRNFIESDFGYTPRPTSKRKSTSTGFLSSRSSRLPGENDDDLTLAKTGLAKLEHHLNETSKSIEKLSKARRVLGQANAELADQLITFSTVENYQPLANGIKRLGRTHKTLGDWLIGQSGAEMVALGDSFAYQAMNAKSAKDTLSSRDSIVDEHRSAIKATISRRRNIEKLKSSAAIRAERVDEALDELDEAVKHEQLLSARLSAISQNLSPSLSSHAHHTHDDLLQSLLQHARISTLHEKQILKELELVRPELKAIREVRSGVIYQGQVGPRSPHLNTAHSNRIGASTGMGRTNSNTSSIHSVSSPSIGVGAGQSNNYNTSTSSTTTVMSDSNTTSGGNDPLRPNDRSQVTNTMTPPVQKRSVRSMASSVVVQGDQRQRVDARMAASMLANGF